MLGKFQSTQPKRAATHAGLAVLLFVHISIHAAQEGCDYSAALYFVHSRHFNPRSPRGLRPLLPRSVIVTALFQSTQPKRAATEIQLVILILFMQFQSTQPKRAATKSAGKQRRRIFISIHAAQEGCDQNAIKRTPRRLEFQSTQPKRAATSSSIKPSQKFIFQSTQPKRAATITMKRCLIMH